MMILIYINGCRCFPVSVIRYLLQRLLLFLPEVQSYPQPFVCKRYLLSWHPDLLYGLHPWIRLIVGQPRSGKSQYAVKIAFDIKAENDRIQKKLDEGKLKENELMTLSDARKSC